MQVPAPGTVPASVVTEPTPAPPPTPSPIVAEETPASVVASTPAPSQEAPAKSRPRVVAPEDEVADVDVIGPMKPGDLIRAGLPNVQAPVPDQLASPVYPATAALGSGKRVTVRVLVDENGRVVEAKIRDGGGADFDVAALEAARRTTFYPAIRDDIPGKMWTELIFEF